MSIEEQYEAARSQIKFAIRLARREDDPSELADAVCESLRIRELLAVADLAWKYSCLGPHDETERRTLQEKALRALQGVDPKQART